MLRPPPPPPPLCRKHRTNSGEFGTSRRFALLHNPPGLKKTRNKKSSPWISYFLGFGPAKNQRNKKSSPWISYFLCFWPGQKTRK